MRRAPQDTPPCSRVSLLVHLVRLVGMALRSLARSAHLESTQKILVNPTAWFALPSPYLFLHVVQPAMPALLDSMGATVPPPRARLATWVLSPILLALRSVPDAATMMTLVPPSGPRLGNVSAEGSFCGSMPTGQAQSRVARAWKALDCLKAAAETISSLHLLCARQPEFPLRGAKQWEELSSRGSGSITPSVLPVRHFRAQSRMVDSMDAAGRQLSHRQHLQLLRGCGARHVRGGALEHERPFLVVLCLFI